MLKITILGFLLLAGAICYSYQGYNETDPYRWGLYKPQLIHAISQSTNNPLVVSQAYFRNHEASLTLRYQFPKRRSDKIIYNYRVNTGVGNYASQEVYDPLLGDLQMLQNYIRLNPTDWIDTTRNITSKSKSLKNKHLEVGFIYAIAFENFEQPQNGTNNSTATRSLLIKNITQNEIVIVSSCLQHKITIIGKNLAEKISFRGIASDEKDNWDVESLLKKIKYNFNNSVENNSTIIFVKTATKLNVGAEIQVYYTPNVNAHYIYIDDQQITNALDPYVQKNFNAAFNVENQTSTNLVKQLQSQNQFQLIRYLIQVNQKRSYSQLAQQRTISKSEMTCATQSFYNLMGGIQYTYGNLLCAQDEEICQEYLPLFSTTPSRLGFPRPFLWDDGFHQMLSCQWDLDFCKQDIEKWFNTISSSGWIPREQPRGPEDRSYIPGLYEDNKDGNPPSFLFNLLYIQKQEGQEEYIQKLIPKIELWFGWWMNIQSVQQDTNSTSSDLLLFKWWGPKETYNLGSGMDDWPRVENFDEKLYVSKYNIDASAWAYFFSQSLAILTNNSTYTETAEKIKNSINEVLLNKEDSIYYDMLYNTTVNKHGQNFTQYHLSTHLGYPNFLPLMLGLVNDTKILEKQILAMMNQDTLWTPYGIRSLSEKDEYFGKSSNYWRGPIWINMQYMILRSMKLYYWDSSDIVQEFYETLRQNVIQTVCGEFETRGYFFEHFNQKLDGKGAGNHPFNGWTSLITLIITESYI
ncbi:mannosyl-oligosaccharide glucosidase (macronuclear) [Tetrahymena thermophila SB210]|uniref:mannosyl-oligosaccharide glucosidase n=1 Tax=Tetrahymena thermophila (strain SB210) TaxID=312017 RepID=I7MAW7_TETTS|nr:mannosyl-oligosaccharide glucosidase [Tetrahymena thermophila SB210]EAS06289.1 mannosyl-oligosaccharide glucosidase [Tetrahymena thermophila SB210]|eukprot:XP_001026534.1 mannosyl-oligosaccharide glucosidase [Tetrahymena thermophila SB210]